MAVQRLVLTDFRSYASLSLNIDAPMITLTGANGAGKTNLLEAISFLVPGRGLRAARLTDIARRETGNAKSSQRWGVAATVEGLEGFMKSEPVFLRKWLLRIHGAPCA